MTTKLVRLGRAGALAVTAAACGGGPVGTEPPPPPDVGSVKLVMQTVGIGPDPDGYAARLAQGPEHTVPTDGTITFSNVAPGTHTVEITGVASNCTLGLPAPTVTVEAGKVSQVQAVVTCRVDLRGRLVVVSEATGAGQLVAMRPDGTDRITLFADGFSYAGPAIFPDGSRVVYTKSGAGTAHVYVYDIASLSELELPEPGVRNFQPAVSPDGTRIAFNVMIGPPGAEAFRIWVMGADGSDPVALTSGPVSDPSDGSPAWSPDGQWIVFSRTGTLMKIHPDGSGLAPMACPAEPCDHPTWSPDGQWLAYTGMSDDNGDGIGDNYDIYVMRPDGSENKRLTTSPDQEDNPAWSPDGTMLAYNHVINNNIEVFRMMADGSGQGSLSKGLAEGLPAWGPAP